MRKEEEDISSSKNSGSFYDNMLNEMQMMMDEEQGKSYLKKSGSMSMAESIDESLEASIREKVNRFSIAHEVTVEIENDSPKSNSLGDEKIDTLLKNVVN